MGSRRGFTLIEVILVVVIVGVLAAMAIPRLSRGVSGSRDAALEGDLAMLRTAVENYAKDHGGSFPGAGTFTAQVQGYTDGSGNVGASAGGAVAYGPYLTIMPASPVGARAGGTGVAASDGSGVGWIYNAATGGIQVNVTTETDANGTLYSAY